MKKFKSIIAKLFKRKQKEDSVLAVANASANITKIFKETCTKLEENMEAAQRAIEEEQAEAERHQKRAEELATVKEADEKFVNNLKAMFA